MRAIHRCSIGHFEKQPVVCQKEFRSRNHAVAATVAMDTPLNSDIHGTVPKIALRAAPGAVKTKVCALIRRNTTEVSRLENAMVGPRPQFMAIDIA